MFSSRNPLIYQGTIAKKYRKTFVQVLISEHRSKEPRNLGLPYAATTLPLYIIGKVICFWRVTPIINTLADIESDIIQSGKPDITL